MIRTLTNTDENANTNTEGEDYEPKTASMPDPVIYPFSSMCDLLDIGELPEHLKDRAWSMLEKHALAFGFDGCLGNHPVKAQIRTKEGIDPISLLMYSSSPTKREVIDKQIDAWITQDVIEPSKSPWGAPVVIAYRNSKAWFCINYWKLNEVTIPDEFPIPCQMDMLAALFRSQVLSSLDALSRFTQLQLHEDNIKKTAFRSH